MALRNWTTDCHKYSEHKLSIRRQCELLGINRSSLYYKKVDPSKEQILLKEQLMARIDYHHTRQPYLGTRKIAKLLNSDGFKVGRKLVRSLMAEMGIRAICPKPNLSKRDYKAGIVPYLLSNTVISFPNQVWSVDITYIKIEVYNNERPHQALEYHTPQVVFDSSFKAA